MPTRPRRNVAYHRFGLLTCVATVALPSSGCVDPKRGLLDEDGSPGSHGFPSMPSPGYFGQLLFVEHDPTGAPTPPRTTYGLTTTDGITKHWVQFYVMQVVLPECWPCVSGIEDVLFLNYRTGSVSCDSEGNTVDFGWRGLDYPLGGYGGHGQLVPTAFGGATLSYEFFDHATDGDGLAVYDDCDWLPGLSTWNCESGFWVPIERASFPFTSPPETCDAIVGSE